MSDFIKLAEDVGLSVAGLLAVVVADVGGIVGHVSGEVVGLAVCGLGLWSARVGGGLHLPGVHGEQDDGLVALACGDRIGICGGRVVGVVAGAFLGLDRWVVVVSGVSHVPGGSSPGGDESFSFFAVLVGLRIGALVGFVPVSPRIFY